MAEESKAAVEPTIPPVMSSSRRSSLARRTLKRVAGQRVMMLSLLFGLVGGAVGSYAFVQFGSGMVPVAKRQIVVQESSAVIDVAKKVSPSVVSITSQSVSRGFFGQAVQQEGAGTGIIVTSDGLIMTNKHVASDVNATYTVVMADGKELKNAKVVAQDTVNDIAFIRVSATGLPAAKLGDSSKIQVGQRVVAIGNALGEFQNTVTEGIISGTGRPVTASDSGSGANAETLTDLFQTDAAINPGNSGGPLVNLDGEVIGMNTAVAGQDSQNIGFAIPINDAMPLITSVKEQGKIVRPYLGVRYVELTKELAAANNLSVSDGAWLQADGSNQAVVSGSPAAKAGLKEGDIITKVGGAKVTATNSLPSLLGKRKVGDKVTLTIVRDGKTQTIDVTLQSAPDGA